MKDGKIIRYGLYQSQHLPRTNMPSIKKLFFSVTHPEISVFPYAVTQITSITTAILDVRFFYFVLLYFGFIRITQWERYIYSSLADPLWPVLWITPASITIGYSIILGLFMGGTLLAAIFPNQRICRILAFLGFFEYTAYVYSFGKIDHAWHIWILTAFIFIFLPSSKHESNNTSSFSKNFLLVFWFAQAFTLLTYSMAGLWKVAGIIEQFMNGEIHALLPQAMALHIADRLLSTNGTSLIGPWIIDNYWRGLLLLPGGIYIEFFSFYIAFKPKLHKIWGVLLILLHIGNYFILAIPFRDTILLLAILFLNTPFEKPHTPWQERIKDLPLIGFLLNTFLKKSNNGN